RLGVLARLADVTPVVHRAQLRVPRVAALAPEVVERFIAGWAARMVGRALDRAESRVVETAEGTGVGFALLEEADAQAAPPVGRIQHRFAQVEDARYVVAVGAEGRPKSLFGLL